MIRIKREYIFLMLIAMVSMTSCVTEKNWQQTVNTLSQPLEKKYLQYDNHQVDMIICPTSDKKNQGIQGLVSVRYEAEPIQEIPGGHIRQRNRL